MKIAKEYHIEGMDCAGCAQHLQEAVSKLDGIGEVTVNFVNGKMRLMTTDQSSSDARIINVVKKAGYKAISTSNNSEASKSNKWLLLVLSGLFLFCGMILDIFLSLMVISKIAIVCGILLGGVTIAKKAVLEIENKRPGMNFLMSMAIIGAMFIGEWLEAGTVVFLFALAQYLELRSMDKARKSVNRLMDESPKTAHLILNGKMQDIPVDDIKPGDHVAVKPGEKLPADGIVVEGKSFIDQATITGESMPVQKQQGEKVYAGTLNKDGYLEIQVNRSYDDSTFSKIIHLVVEAQTKKAEKQIFIDRFAQYYTPAVFLIAIMVAIIPPIVFELPWEVWFYRSLVILVIACPCALVISTPVTIISGLTAAIRRGVLIKGGIFLENFSHIKAIAFDKTGTLTEGRPVVNNVIVLNDHKREELLAVASSLEKKTQHPIAQAIVDYAENEKIDFRKVSNFKSFDGKGVQGKIDGISYLLGNHRLFEEKGLCDENMHHKLEKVEDESHTAVLVGNNHTIMGILSISDALRPQSKNTITNLLGNGVKKIIILTGDNHRTAEKIAQSVDIPDYYAELLPEDKVRVIEDLRERFEQVAMVGDGVNDAPSLAAADIGIALGSGSADVALETADIILMKDDLSKLDYLKSLSHKTMKIIKQNIIIAIGLKIIFLALAIPGLATLWMAVFADMGASLIVIFNGMRTLHLNSHH